MQPNSEYEIIVQKKYNQSTTHDEMTVQMDGRISISDIFEVTRQLMRIILDNSSLPITENMFILGLLEFLKDPSHHDIRIDMKEAAKQAAASGRGDDGAD